MVKQPATSNQQPAASRRKKRKRQRKRKRKRRGRGRGRGRGREWGVGRKGEGRKSKK
jgi:hypothetical protein